jgi:hypothetical protein
MLATNVITLLVAQRIGPVASRKRAFAAALEWERREPRKRLLGGDIKRSTPEIFPAKISLPRGVVGRPGTEWFAKTGSYRNRLDALGRPKTMWSARGRSRTDTLFRAADFESAWV